MGVLLRTSGDTYSAVPTKLVDLGGSRKRGCGRRRGGRVWVRAGRREKSGVT
jgi:hypothetical protein